MATPIPLCQPTQYPSTLAPVAIPWVGTPHVCTPHTVPSTIVDFCGHACTQFQQSPIFHLIVINSASAQCLWATTIHPPPVFPPLHHRSVVAHTTHVTCLLHCGLGCPLHCGWVGVLVVLGDELGESQLCGRSCSWRYSLLHAKFFF